MRVLLKVRAAVVRLVVFAIVLGLFLVLVGMMGSGVDPTTSAAWVDMM